jgi:hypothetical protein
MRIACSKTGATKTHSEYVIQSDSFGNRTKKMRISQRLFIRFWTCIYDYISCFMRSMSILEEMLEIFATTVQAELNATLHVCECGIFLGLVPKESLCTYAFLRQQRLRKRVSTLRLYVQCMSYDQHSYENRKFLIATKFCGSYHAVSFWTICQGGLLESDLVRQYSHL